MKVVEQADVDWREQSDRWPADVRLIVSSLEAAKSLHTHERRQIPRGRFRVKTVLTMFGCPPRKIQIFTRDLSARSAGFITRQQLPLGHDGRIVMPTVDGRAVEIECTVTSCRPFMDGWFDAAVTFRREDPRCAPSLDQTDPPNPFADPTCE